MAWGKKDVELVAELIDFAAQLLPHLADHGATKNKEEEPGDGNPPGLEGNRLVKDTTGPAARKIRAQKCMICKPFSESDSRRRCILERCLDPAPGPVTPRRLCCSWPAEGAPAAVTSARSATPARRLRCRRRERCWWTCGRWTRTIQMDVRYATPNNFTGAPLPGYEAPRALLRREVAAALGPGAGAGSAPADSASGSSTAIARCGRRSRWWTGPSARAAATLLDSGYIARRSRHNLGVAVDLTLVDLVSGTEVPMGTPFDTFTPRPRTPRMPRGGCGGTGRSWCGRWSRRGFSNYEKEWWHFSYPVDGSGGRSTG